MGPGGSPAGAVSDPGGDGRPAPRSLAGRDPGPRHQPARPFPAGADAAVAPRGPSHPLVSGARAPLAAPRGPRRPAPGGTARRSARRHTAVPVLRPAPVDAGRHPVQLLLAVRVRGGQPVLWTRRRPHRARSAAPSPTRWRHPGRPAAGSGGQHARDDRAGQPAPDRPAGAPARCGRTAGAAAGSRPGAGPAPECAGIRHGDQSPQPRGRTEAPRPAPGRDPAGSGGHFPGQREGQAPVALHAGRRTAAAAERGGGHHRGAGSAQPAPTRDDQRQLVATGGLELARGGGHPAAVRRPAAGAAAQQPRRGAGVHPARPAAADRLQPDDLRQGHLAPGRSHAGGDAEPDPGPRPGAGRRGRGLAAAAVVADDPPRQPGRPAGRAQPDADAPVQ